MKKEIEGKLKVLEEKRKGENNKFWKDGAENWRKWIFRMKRNVSPGAQGHGHPFELA
jgi:hypothetical protein